MIKRYFSIVLIFAVSVCLMLTTAEAVEIDVSVDYDRQTGRVTISGAVADVEDGETVKLAVLKPGVDLDALDGGQLTFDLAGVHIAEARIESGAFSCDAFILQGLPAGDYTIRLAAAGTVVEIMLPYATEAQALEMADNAGTAEEIKTLVEKYNDFYELKNGVGSLFSSLEQTRQNQVYSRVANKSYASVEELKNAFDVAVALTKISQGPWGAVDRVLNGYAALLNLDVSRYARLTNAEKDKVCKALTGSEYEDEDALDSALGNAVADVENERGSGGGGGASGSAYNPKTSPSYLVPLLEETSGEAAAYFSDVDTVAWAKDSAIRLFLKGVINGKGGGVFAPNDPVTRGEAVKMIVLAFGEIDAEAQADFSDVGIDDWQYPYVATASKLGIVNGYADGSFNKDTAITREELCAMLYRSANIFGLALETKNAEITFEDGGDIASYAAEAVRHLQMAGVINGTGGNKFEPAENATRAQAAKMIDFMSAY